MKKLRFLFTSVSMLAVILAGLSAWIILSLTACSSAGYPSKPGSLAARFLDTQTNYIPIVVRETNKVPIFETNRVLITVTETNIQGVTVPLTNFTYIPVFRTQEVVIQKTNLAEAYQVTPNANAQAVKDTGTAVGNLFGVGGLVGTGLSLLFGAWAQIRSGRRYNTAANLTQTIEMMREFIKQLPQGANYDAALVNWMQTHQMQAGVADQVLELLVNQTDNDAARGAAETLHQSLHALMGVTGSVTAQDRPIG